MYTMKQDKAVVRIVITAIVVHVALGYSMQDVDKLIKDKLANYNTNLRPVQNQSLPVHVSAGLELVSVKEFDEVTEKITIAAVHQLFWYDETFKWDPEKYEGIEMITINESDVWKPTLFLVNTFDKLEEVGGSSFVVRVNSSGLMQWYPGSVLSAVCQVDTTYYPWDTQTCGFEFISWAFIASEIKLHLLSDVVSTNYYTPSGIWDLVGSSCYSPVEDSLIKFEIEIKRKPVFIFVNVILPIIFMSCLNLVAFLIPTECGERISYCITVLLSIAVFLTIVGDNLPKTSNPMSILSYYLLTVLGISICITLATIFSLRIYFRDEKESVSACWRGFVRIFRCRCLTNNRQKLARETRANRYSPRHKTSSKGEAPEESYPRINQTTASRYKDSQYEWNKGQLYTIGMGGLNGGNYDHISRRTFISNMAMPADDDEPEPQDTTSTIDEVSWKDVSIAVDNLCFALFLIIYVCCSTGCLVVMVTNV